MDERFSGAPAAPNCGGRRKASGRDARSGRQGLPLLPSYRVLTRWLALAVGVVWAAILVMTLPASAGFYDTSPADLRGPPGSIIRYQAMDGAPAGAWARLVLYRSTGANGEPIAVSAIIVAPLEEGAPGRPPDRRLGAPDDRRHPKMRAVAAGLSAADDPGPRQDAAERVRGGGHGLSRPRHRRASIPISSASAKAARSSIQSAPPAGSAISAPATGTSSGATRKAGTPPSSRA